jgi:hypothetical protein
VTPEKTSAYEEPAAGGGEAPGHRTDAESEAPEILKEPHDANDKPLAEHNEAPSRHSSGKSVDVVDNGKVIIQQPKASSSSEPIREPVKSKVCMTYLTTTEGLIDPFFRLVRRVESKIASPAFRQVSI